MHYKEDFDERKGNVSELVNVLKALELDGKPFSQFLEDTILASEQDKIGPSDFGEGHDHSRCKGTGVSGVFVVALEEAIFRREVRSDNNQALEEERRLFMLPSQGRRKGYI